MRIWRDKDAAELDFDNETELGILFYGGFVIEYSAGIAKEFNKTFNLRQQILNRNLYLLPHRNTAWPLSSKSFSFVAVPWSNQCSFF